MPGVIEALIHKFAADIFIITKYRSKIYFAARFFRPVPTGFVCISFSSVFGSRRVFHLAVFFRLYASGDKLYRITSRLPQYFIMV